VRKNTIFKGVQVDNEEIYTDIKNNDFLLWKIHKFIKNLDEVKRVKKCLGKYQDKIKMLQVNL